MGGSIAWQAARAGVPRILGYTSTPKDGVAAARAGAITELMQDLRRLVRNSDFVVVSAPPRATMTLMGRAASLLRGGGRYMTDVSSVKLPLVNWAQEQNLSSVFAGSHPLVDVREGGFRSARPDLFAGQIVYVTAAPDGERAGREVADFWERVLQAEPVTLDAQTHDSVVAWTRHLPHAAAAALAVTLGSHGPKGVTYGSETRSATALAGGPPDALVDVLLLNRDAIVEALQTMDRSLHDLGSALADNDEARVRTWLDAASSWRSRLGS